jgi:hypothetical protein
MQYGMKTESANNSRSFRSIQQFYHKNSFTKMLAHCTKSSQSKTNTHATLKNNFDGIMPTDNWNSDMKQVGSSEMSLTHVCEVISFKLGCESGHSD